MAKTAAQKRDQAPPPRVELLREPRDDGHPAGRMLIASPLEVQELIRRIPEGRVLRLADLRATLALKFRADYACEPTTMEFLHTVAAASYEERSRAALPTPYWRVVRDDGQLFAGLPGGVAAQAGKLEGEGVDVFRLGQRVMIGNVEHFAWTPPPPRRRGAAAAEPSDRPMAGQGKPRNKRPPRR